MNDRSRKSVKHVAILLAAALFMVCFTTACQPIVQEAGAAVSASASVQTTQTAVVASESPVLDTGTAVSSLKVPAVYKFNTVSPDRKITVEANAPVILPKADKIPTAKATVGQFTHAQVSGMLKYLYGDTPYYADSTASNPVLSDGMMQKDASSGRETISVHTGNMDTGMTTFECGNGDGIESDNYIIVNTSGISYINNPGSPKGIIYPLYTMDKAVQITGDADIPANTAAKLGVTLTQAKAKVDGLLDAAGINDMQMAAAYIVDDHGTVSNGNTNPAKNYAIQLFYGRTINGVPVMTMGEDLVLNPEKKTDHWWMHEQLQARINSKGIIKLTWSSPDAVDGPLTAESTFIDFEQATAIFEKNIIPFYQKQPWEAGTKSTDIKINSVQLGLFRLKQQSVQGKVTGKFVPVWAFYGTNTMKTSQQETLYNYGSRIIGGGGPFIVYCINALDGSVIDITKGD